MATIAERIKEALDLRGMKQSELVEKTGIGKSSISTYISGEYEPKQRNIYKIAKALDVNESWLMGFDVPIEREKISTGAIKINNKVFNSDKIVAAIAKALTESKKDTDSVDKLVHQISDEILKKVILIDENLTNPKLEVITEKNEILLVKNYRQLNFKGQHEASKRVEELTYIDKYIKEVPNYIQPVAAHLDGELTDEVKDFIDKF
jgi:transcriptional regulator with XRE-family HTH domain